MSLDITGAFDNVSHRRIIELMTKYRVSSYLVAQTRSYLIDRASTNKTTSKGCPQGSACGPNLFLIVMNDLLTKLAKFNMGVFAYADDVLLVLRGHSTDLIAAKANLILQFISDWGAENQLAFNPAKTQVMLVRAGCKAIYLPPICMQQEIVPSGLQVKFLGIVFSHKLSWLEHLKQTKSKAEKVFGVLHRLMSLKGGIHRDLRRQLYYSIVEPIANYGAPVWINGLDHPAGERQFRQLEQFMSHRYLAAYATSKYEDLMYLSGFAGLKSLAEVRSFSYCNREMPWPDRKRAAARLKDRLIQQNGSDMREGISENLKRFVGNTTEISTNAWKTFESMVFLTQKGFFINRREQQCPDCGDSVRCSPVHTLLECVRWRTERRDLHEAGISAVEHLNEIFTNESKAAIFDSLCKTIFRSN